MKSILAALCLLSAFSVVAQTTPQDSPKTDADKIADALRAGPTFITEGATLLDWPASPAGEYRVLRKGTNEWTCLPGVPGYSHDEPGCFDSVFMQWIKDSLAGREPHIDRTGIAYMYVGAWLPNKSHNGQGDEFHVGPHIMIVSPHQFQDELRALNHDGSNGMPYVAHLPSGRDLYLVMPIREATIQSATTEPDGAEEVKRLYKQLIDAENRHDLPAVRDMVWDSPSTLFVAKAPVGWHGYWGIEDVIQHLHDMYQQPFRIDPLYEEEKVVFITPEIAETYAPVRITVAYGGQTPVPKPFVMVLLWIRTPQGWKITTDIPIPVPPDPATP